MEAKYELTVGGRLGPGPADAKEVRVLNRIVRWTSKGIAYEADPRQVEKLLQEVYVPLLTNPRNQEGWGESVSKEVMDKAYRLLAVLHPKGERVDGNADADVKFDGRHVLEDH